ncbi:MAG: nucleotidyltransferase domain-containing protein [Thermoplasmatota archaeon]
MYQKGYTINKIASTVAMNVLRDLYQNLHRYISPSEISKDLNTTRANVHRGLNRIEEVGLLRRSSEKKRSLVRIDTSSRDAFPFFQLFNNERIRNLEDSTVQNIYNIIKNTEIKSVILFGSYSRGQATDRSDVDLLIITNKSDIEKEIRERAISMLPETRFDIHFYTEENLEKRSDLIMVDAILYGISFTGDRLLYERRKSLESIDTSYIRWRLDSCMNNLKRSQKTEGEAGKYFINVARRTLQEIISVMRLDHDMDNTRQSIKEGIDLVKDDLKRRGEKIWLS